MKRFRLWLAKWIWPKEVKAGELFTITRHLDMDGNPQRDGSWVGDTCRCEKVDGDRIAFSVQREWDAQGRWERINSHWLIPNRNCLIKYIGKPLSKEERKALRAVALP